MADLLDIVPSTAVEEVMVGDEPVTVYGVSIGDMASIVSKFPDLKKVATGEGGDVIALLITGCGKAVGPIIAAGCGHLGDERYEQRAAQLLPEQQIRFLRAILGLTFPNGIGSFVEELTGLMSGAGEGAKTVKLRLKTSQSNSPTSSDAASIPTLQ